MAVLQAGCFALRGVKLLLRRECAMHERLETIGSLRRCTLDTWEITNYPKVPVATIV